MFYVAWLILKWSAAIIFVWTNVFLSNLGVIKQQQKTKFEKWHFCLFFNWCYTLMSGCNKSKAFRQFKPVLTTDDSGLYYGNMTNLMITGTTEYLSIKSQCTFLTHCDISLEWLLNNELLKNLQNSLPCQKAQKWQWNKQIMKLQLWYTTLKVPFQYIWHLNSILSIYQ